MSRIVVGLIAAAAIACGSPRPEPQGGGEPDVPAVWSDAAVAAAAGGFYCYSWVHGEDFSTPCYPTLGACDAAAGEMRTGARDVTACEAAASVWCALVDDERCFETGSECARFVQDVAADGKTLPSCQLVGTENRER